MSRWNRWDDYPSVPARPPEHGIKVKQIGSTWWGQRWIQALEAISDGYSGRLARGRAYARSGRVHDLVVAGGKVTARVTGSRPEPYEVTIALATLSDAAWSQAIQAMAEQARFAAELLAGQMPAELDDAFRAGDTSLFPVAEADLTTTCSCPDWANPCKHVAATHYVLGEALDRDPFLLLELRGRGREQVLAELRAARASRGPDEEGKEDKEVTAGAAAKPRRRRSSEAGEGAEIEIPTVKLPKLSAAEYDRPRAPLPVLHLGLEAPAAPGALLRQLGKPGSWSSDASPVDLLAPLVRAAAESARELALAEPAPAVAEAPDVDAVPDVDAAADVDGVDDIGEAPGHAPEISEPPAASGPRPAKPRRTRP